MEKRHSNGQVQTDLQHYPFSDELLKEGVGFSLALELFREGVVTAARAARLADMPVAEFLEKVSHLEIPVVDYPPEELTEELLRLE